MLHSTFQACTQSRPPTAVLGAGECSTVWLHAQAARLGHASPAQTQYEDARDLPPARGRVGDWGQPSTSVQGDDPDSMQDTSSSASGQPPQVRLALCPEDGVLGPGRRYCLPCPAFYLDHAAAWHGTDAPMGFLAVLHVLHQARHCLACTCNVHMCCSSNCYQPARASGSMLDT